MCPEGYHKSSVGWPFSGCFNLISTEDAVTAETTCNQMKGSLAYPTNMDDWSKIETYLKKVSDKS